MNLSKEKFEEIKLKYYNLVLDNDDVMMAFNFVREVLEAEADAIEEKEHYDINAIKGYNHAAYTIFEFSQEIEG